MNNKLDFIGTKKLEKGVFLGYEFEQPIDFYVDLLKGERSGIMGTPERRKEIIDVCLQTFMKNGLAHTSTRDLCDALNMQAGGIFYYYNTKDEIIIACAEEATVRIERDLIGVALKDVDNPEKLAKDLYDRAVAMRPLMKFFVSVCSTSKYDEAIQPSLDKLSERYKVYTEQFADKLCCSPKDVAPYVYIVINTMLSYMLFGKKNFVAPQLELVYNALKEMLKIRDSKKAI